MEVALGNCAVPIDNVILAFGVIRVGVLTKTTAPDPVEEVIVILGVAPPEEARGEEAVTEVTVPVVGVDQDGTPEARVRTWPLVPVGRDTMVLPPSE